MSASLTRTSDERRYAGHPAFLAMKLRSSTSGLNGIPERSASTASTLMLADFGKVSPWTVARLLWTSEVNRPSPSTWLSPEVGLWYAPRVTYRTKGSPARTSSVCTWERNAIRSCSTTQRSALTSLITRIQATKRHGSPAIQAGRPIGGVSMPRRRACLRSSGDGACD